MDEEDGLLQSLVIQYLLAHTQCSACGRSFEADDLRIRAHRGGVWLTAVTCSHCGQQGLIMAAIKTRDARDPQSALEAGEGESAGARAPEPITADEVLDWHCFLDQFHGDVHQLFGEHSGSE